MNSEGIQPYLKTIQKQITGVPRSVIKGPNAPYGLLLLCALPLLAIQSLFFEETPNGFPNRQEQNKLQCSQKSARLFQKRSARTINGFWIARHRRSS